MLNHTHHSQIAAYLSSVHCSAASTHSFLPCLMGKDHSHITDGKTPSLGEVRRDYIVRCQRGKETDYADRLAAAQEGRHMEATNYEKGCRSCDWAKTVLIHRISVDSALKVTFVTLSGLLCPGIEAAMASLVKIRKIIKALKCLFHK